MKRIKFFSVLCLAISCPVAFATSLPNINIPDDYVWTQSSLTFDLRTPPALVYIADSQGRKTGADFSVPINSNGEQNWPHGGLSQIPLSSVEQQNVGDDENGGQADTSTGWIMTVLDSPKQTFALHVKGITSAATTIYVGVGFQNGNTSSGINTSIPILVEQNVERVFEVNFDPDSKMISTVPVIASGGLLSDAKMACQLDFITSRRTCEYLEKEAKLVEQALDKHHEDEAKTELLVFLHALGDSRPFGCRDEDYRADVKEPALTILKEDSKALLKGLGPQKDGHDGQEDHHEDRSRR